jgi:uncharacterized membrane protein
MLDEVVGTLAGRWYVTLFGAAFLWSAGRHLGWRRTITYAVVAFAVGALAENASVHLGFPYTRYEFDSSLRGDELWVGDVPLFVPLSYGFMGYFAFATGRLLASGPWRLRAGRPWTEYLLAVVLAVWALWVVDPMSRLGERFYLGEVFRYEGPGFWFGLPLGSQLGFTLTALVLVSLLAWLARGEPDRAVPAGLARHPHLPALVTYSAQVLHLAVVGWVIGGQPADAIAGSAVLIYLPLAAMVAVHWAALRPAPAGQAAVEHAEGRDLAGTRG